MPAFPALWGTLQINDIATDNSYVIIHQQRKSYLKTIVKILVWNQLIAVDQLTVNGIRASLLINLCEERAARALREINVDTLV